MELNINKINRELKRLDKTAYWLAREAGVSKQLVSYWFRTKSLSGAERIAKALDLDPKDLLI